MRHKFLFAAGVLSCAIAAAALAVRFSANEGDGLMQANIEALADGEFSVSRPIWFVIPTEHGWDCYPDGNKTCIDL